MTEYTNAQLAGNYMAAVAHLLGGQPGRYEEFVQKVEIILSEVEPNLMSLMHYGETARRTGRPLVWFHQPEETPQIPLIGLSAFVDGRSISIENCLLHSSRDGKIIRLVPDSFGFGAFEFDADLRLRHLPKPPAKTYEACKPALIRAYRRLVEIHSEQLRRGDVFPEARVAHAA